MRKKVVYLTIGGVAFLLLVAYVVDRSLPQQEWKLASAPEHQPVDANPALANEAGLALSSSNITSNGPGPGLLPDPEMASREAKEQKISQLADLQMNEDAASLNAILNELDNPDREIRSAALEAAIQFGERTNTIARLKELEVRTEDVLERKAIHEAIDYIALPSLTEVMNERKKAASGQTGGTSSKTGKTVSRPSIAKPAQAKDRMPSPSSPGSASF